MNITVKNLTYKYDNNNALSDISFVIKSNSFVGIVGHNGSGKSTLINCLLKINKVANNTIFYDGVDINQFKQWDKIGYVGQNSGEKLTNFTITVRETLCTVADDKSRENLLSVLKLVGMSEYLDENLNHLSGGQRQRIFIARALVNKPQLLILDEPFVGIDEDNTLLFYKSLKLINDLGTTIIVVTHNLDHLSHYLTNILALKNNVRYFGEIAGFDGKMCDVC